MKLLNFPNLTLTQGLSQTWHIYWCSEYYWPWLHPFNLNFLVRVDSFGLKLHIFSVKRKSENFQFWIFKWPKSTQIAGKDFFVNLSTNVSQNELLMAQLNTCIYITKVVIMSQRSPLSHPAILIMIRSLNPWRKTINVRVRFKCSIVLDYQ